MSQHGPDLGDALSALRALGDDAGGDPVTRGRVLDSLERSGQHRRTLVSFGIVLAISMVGTTAWGLASGWLPAVVRTIIHDAPPAPPAAAPQAAEPPPARQAKRRAAPERDQVEPLTVPLPALSPMVAAAPPTPTPPPAPPPAPPVAAIAPPPPPARPPTPARKPQPRPVAPPVAVTPSPPPAATATAPSPPPPPAPAEPAVAPPPPEQPPLAELRLYRVAHAAHFRGNDAARALAAWDAYLAAFPDGKLALEARWNRALVLVKLQRKNAALRALEPFASGSGYRQAEARRLIDALNVVPR